MMALQIKPRKILLRVPNWIGDALLTTPIIHGLKKNLSDSEITVLARPWVAPIFEANPEVNGLILYEHTGLHQGIQGKLHLARLLRARKFEAVIHFPHSFESAWISHLSRIPIRIGYATEGRRWLLTHPLRSSKDLRNVHQVSYFFHLLEPLGIKKDPSPEKDPLRLTVAPEHKKKMALAMKTWGISSKDPLVGIAPGAIYGSAKCWPFRRFEELAEKIRQAWQARVVLLGTVHDAQGVPVKDNPPYLNLVGKTGLGEALALMEKCRLIIANDSGLMHAATALKIPLVALFGPTDLNRTGPWGKNFRIVRKDFPCSPCLKKNCPEQQTCLEAIGVEEVWEAVRGFKDQVLR
jgi:lipopolysaccharide heptosyltransferase II